MPILTPDESTVRSVVENQLRVYNIPFDTTLSDLGAKDFQLSLLNHRLLIVFDKQVAVTFKDTVYTIVDKLNK